MADFKDTSYYKEGSINGDGKLASGYRVVGSWAGNQRGVVSGDIYDSKFGPGTSSVPVFAKTSAVLALNKLNINNEEKWQITIGKVPSKFFSGGNSTYAPELLNGDGFIFRFRSRDYNYTVGDSDELLRGLIEAGFNKINMGLAGSDKVVYAARAGTGLYLSGTSVEASKEAHPVYRLHKMVIGGKYMLIHSDAMKKLPISSAKYFTNFKTLVHRAPYLAGPLRQKLFYVDRQDEIYGDNSGREPVRGMGISVAALSSLIDDYLADRLDDERIDNFSPRLVEILQKYGVMGYQEPTPQPTIPDSGDDTGGFGTGTIGDDITQAGDEIQKNMNVVQRFINLFNSTIGMGTQLKNIWNTVTAALIAKQGAGFLGLTTLGAGLSISALIALGIGGQFAFRKYLKNRKNLRQAREASRDRQLMRELGIVTEPLKKNASDEEIQALIRELERQESRDPQTRKLYDL
tara:strand:+ start:29020 stop:30402 length:1383 start_codon:yes stop_codon:yes gene_type:complete